MYSDMGIQNCIKMVNAANHIMNDDPCRMWMYGACCHELPSTGIWLATMAKSLFIFFSIFFSFSL